MPSDFSNVKVCACVGCGRTSDQVALKRLSTYSRSWACLRCYVRHTNCGVCQHEKHAKQTGDPTPCARCGCTSYRHGLEQEFDRQLDGCVGKKPLSRKCLRGCGRDVYRRPDDTMPLWCSVCESERKQLSA